MAQQIALRVHADRSGRRVVAFHPTCHLELHEDKAYQRLHGLVGRPVGNARELMTLDDLAAVKEPLAAVVFELPQREIGGLLPSWHDLRAQVALVRETGAAVHLDGARLWECTAYFGKGLQEIAALFDSVYVSFYKGLGGLAGCCLAGDESLVGQAREWRSRHGGTLFAMWPYAAAGLVGLRDRLPRMGRYVAHARAIAERSGWARGRRGAARPAADADDARAPAHRCERLPRCSPSAGDRGQALGRAAQRAVRPGRLAAGRADRRRRDSRVHPRAGPRHRHLPGLALTSVVHNGREWEVTVDVASEDSDRAESSPGPWRPRLVATDLDGTIVGPSGEISDRTVRVLRRVEDLGVPVVFVTGRPPRWLGVVSERTGRTGLAICANGAIVYDLHTEQVVAHHPISIEIGLEIASRLRETLPDVVFAVETLDGYAREHGYRPRWDVGLVPTLGPIDEIFDRGHRQTAHPPRVDGCRQVAGRRARGRRSTSPSSRTPRPRGLLEVSAAGVSKATTLAELCAERGIDAADVIAFGDMPNDLAMLAWAGTAYAVAGAHPEVLAAVERHTGDPVDDGVAEVLERLFDLPRD